MAYSVTVNPSGKEFTVESNQFVLEAGIKSGIVLPYGCKNGACGSCKCKLISGEIEQGAHQLNALTVAESQAGMILTCCATLKSNITIEARVVAAAGDIPIRKMPCRIASLTRAAPDVMIMKLQLPAAEKLQYLAGQFVELILKDGSRRAYSMACAPHLADQIELHVRHLPGGKFTDPLFGLTQPALKEKDILRFEGPLGTFFLREDSDKPIVLVASGTGFAPIKALVEQAQFKSITRPMTLYWGARRPQDLYMHELCLQWAQEIPHFKYIPVVSDALAQDDWQGRSGFVHKAVMHDFADMSTYQVYACGAPIVIDSAQKEFVEQCHLPADEFYADSFTTAADSAASSPK
jgi:CDP-4-dehydro-6-deoxyglucose reductase, E3